MQQKIGKYISNRKHKPLCLSDMEVVLRNRNVTRKEHIS